METPQDEGIAGRRGKWGEACHVQSPACSAATRKDVCEFINFPLVCFNENIGTKDRRVRETRLNGVQIVINHVKTRRRIFQGQGVLKEF